MEAKSMLQGDMRLTSEFYGFTWEMVSGPSAVGLLTSTPSSDCLGITCSSCRTFKTGAETEDSRWRCENIPGLKLLLNLQRGTWMNLENIILSKLTQEQKTNTAYSHSAAANLKEDLRGFIWLCDSAGRRPE
ncbi:uncharacterized protein LOC118152723 isoform X1 [Callithrix jacchus]